MSTIHNKHIRIPDYSLSEELFNSISHGVGALLSVGGLTLMAVKARGALAVTTACIFGSTMVLLYTISCLYHALPARLMGKKVLRVLDHCNVFLLVAGTYLPASLLGVGGALGWLLLAFVLLSAFCGILFNALDLDRYSLASVICHLLSGWSIVLGVPALKASMGLTGLLWVLFGGVAYSIGAVLYGVGRKKRYAHCVFHIFCLIGSFCHFWGIYRYLL